MGHTIHRSLIVTATVIYALSGCGKASEELLERRLESEFGGEVELDLDDDGGFSMEASDGDDDFSFTSSTEFPEQWPGDVIRPDGIALVTSSFFREGEDQTIFVSGFVDGDGVEYAEAYGSALVGDGFEMSSLHEYNGSTTAVYEQSDRTLTVHTVFVDGDHQVTITLTTVPA